MNKKFLATLALILGLGACESEQTLSIKVNKSLKVYKAPNNMQTLEIPANDYSMKITTGSSTSAIQMVNPNGQVYEFKTKSLKSLGDFTESTTSQNIFISANQLKQTFDVQAVSQVSLLSSGPVESRYVTCVAGYQTRYRRQCYPGRTYCEGRGDYRRCYREPDYCETVRESVPVYGTQNIRQRIHTYVTKSQLHILQHKVKHASTEEMEYQFTREEVLGRSTCY